MASPQMLQEITEIFGEIVASDDKLVAECVNMCQMFNMTPENLFYKWEALSFNSTRSINVFTMDSAASLKASIQREIAAENNRKQQTRAKLFGKVTRGRVLARGFGAPKAAAAPTGAGISVKGEKDGIVAGPSRVTFKGPRTDAPARQDRSYRYMYEKISERSETLDNRISEFSRLIQDHYNIEEIVNPAIFTEEEVAVVGRITLDAESSSSGSVRLNEASLAIEPSRGTGFGRRIPIRFTAAVKIRGGATGAGGLGFFPGAMVAFRGKNGSGPDGYFLVNEILAMPSMKPSPVQPAVGSSFSMSIACGPYTSDSDLKYEPWYTLVANLKSMRPDIVVLIGPFVDAAHQKIKSGDIDQSAAELYRKHFLENLQDFLSQCPTSIVLIIPSVRDVISDHPVFPQCELDVEFSGDPRIRLLPNPCRFAVNDVSFAVTSLDVIPHLKKEEFLKTGEEVDSLPDPSGADVMGAACRHLLQQRSFYPVFPVPFDLLQDVNLDLTHSGTLALDSEPGIDYAPDVMIVPSKLRHFSKTVQGTVFVNPSLLSKGTCASLSLVSGDKLLSERIKVIIGKHDAVQ